jgi:hypothetical protein
MELFGSEKGQTSMVRQEIMMMMTLMLDETKNV